jgi:hypothetical protein
MADWEAELATLLRELDVSLERDALSDRRPKSQGALANATGRPPATEEPAAVDGDSLGLEMATQAPGVEDDEVSAVRSEIEATLARVMHMTRAGQLEPALRDDVVFVLKALTRPRPAALRPRERHEWQLDSAAAVLHFCRVVLRLTRALAPETLLE